MLLRLFGLPVVTSPGSADTEDDHDEDEGRGNADQDSDEKGDVLDLTEPELLC